MARHGATSCSCIPTLVEPLRVWSESLSALLSVRTTDPAPVSLIPLLCSRSCALPEVLVWRLPIPRALVRFRLVPPLPGSVEPERASSPLLEPLLRDASRVLTTKIPLALGEEPAPVGLLFVPPLKCFSGFSASLDPARVPEAVEVFSALVGDGMPVSQALTAAPRLV